MDLEVSIERFWGVDRGNWARFATPGSGWTRLTIGPLFCGAFASIGWIGFWAAIPIAAVPVFLFLHARIFPPLRDYDHWMSRGLLGERWLFAGKWRDIPSQIRRNFYVGVGVFLISAGPINEGLNELALDRIVLGMSLLIGGQLMVLKSCDLIFQHMTGHVPGTPFTDPMLPPKGDQK